MTVIAVVVRALETVPQGLETRLEEMVIKGRMRSFRTQHFRDRIDYSEEFWKPAETCCHLDSSENHQLTLERKTYQA